MAHELPDLEAVASLRARWLRHDGAQAARREATRTLAEQVALAKGRLALRPDVEALIDALAQRAHERSVGHYESLLSALIRDVLPEGGQRAALTLETKRDLPALSLSVVRDDETGQAVNPEDILDGNGGSLTNVIVAGLRYIALARSGQRPFMVLDEPDCWLRPDRVPAFGRVITQLAHNARGAGIQTLLISHHDPALLDTGFAVHLTREGTNGVGVHRDGECPEFPVDHHGIREITLENCLSHTSTTIPLSPGVTLLTGDNNVGKSAVVTALRAVAYGESQDAFIRHGADAMRVTLVFADGQTLLWERRRKGNPKTLYRLTDANGLVVHEGGAGREVPDWAAALLGIQRIDGLDVQIGNQKDPVFLLNEPDTKRAAILSVGREAGLLDAVRRLWKKQMDADRKTLREGEVRLEKEMRLQERLAPWHQQVQESLSALESASPDLDRLQGQIEKLDQQLARQAALSAQRQIGERLTALGQAMMAPPTLPPVTSLASHLRRLESAQKRQTIWAHLPAAIEEAPVLPDARTLARHLTRFASLQRTQDVYAQLASVPTTPPLPELPDVAALLRRGRQWKVAQAQARIYRSLAAIPPSPPPPILADGRKEQQDLERLERALQRKNEVSRDCRDSEKALMESRAQLRRLEEELGSCPLCGSDLHSETDHALRRPAPPSEFHEEDRMQDHRSDPEPREDGYESHRGPA